MNKQKPSPSDKKAPQDKAKKKPEETEKEIGGYEDSGLQEPTRYGDWEVKGRCSDF